MLFNFNFKLDTLNYILPLTQIQNNRSKTYVDTVNEKIA